MKMLKRNCKRLVALSMVAILAIGMVFAMPNIVSATPGIEFYVAFDDAASNVVPGGVAVVTTNVSGNTVGLLNLDYEISFGDLGTATRTNGVLPIDDADVARLDDGARFEISLTYAGAAASPADGVISTYRITIPNDDTMVDEDFTVTFSVDAIFDNDFSTVFDLTIGSVVITVEEALDLEITLPAGMTELPNGQVGAPYSIQLGTVNAEGDVTWTATGLPTGLTLSATGLLSGTPTADDIFSVTITATDSATPAQVATLTQDITIAPAPTIELTIIDEAGGIGRFIDVRVDSDDALAGAYLVLSAGAEGNPEPPSVLVVAVPAVSAGGYVVVDTGWSVHDNATITATLVPARPPRAMWDTAAIVAGSLATATRTLG